MAHPCGARERGLYGTGRVSSASGTAQMAIVGAESDGASVCR